MSINEENTHSSIRGLLAAQKLPRWDELPDLELYMDQVLALIGRYLSSYPGFDEKGLTASMVNNYVKLGVVPPPVRKRYGRAQLAQLIIVCVLKSSLPIAAIRRIIAGELEKSAEEQLYNGFCEMFEEAVRETAGIDAKEPEEPSAAPILRAALRAQAEQALALKLFASDYPEEEE